MRASSFLTWGLVLALLPAPAARAAGEVTCPNPGLNCQKVLVIPVKYVPPYCPDPGQPCYDDVSFLHDPPRILAQHLGDILNLQVNPHFSDWSYGTWQFQYQVLANPESPDGWWPMPAPFQDYYVSLLSGASFWKHGAAQRAIVEDAIQEIAVPASQGGLIPSLATYSRFIVVDNNHGRGGQTKTISYPVPVPAPGVGGWVWVDHVFTGTWAAVDANDNALESLLSHELMHQLGPGDFYGTCLIDETPFTPFYGECNGPWDVMAFDWEGPSHPTGYNKLATGWLPLDAQRVATLPVAGTAFSTLLDLYPLETLDGTHTRLARIPLAAPQQGTPFEGYHLECRRAIQGDGSLHEEGVLIQRVREAGPGVALQAGMPARVVRSDAPFSSINEAALQPGEIWNDTAQGVTVTFLGYADGTPGGACEVSVDYSAAGGKSDPAFVAMGGDSPDLWMDSKVNGFLVYPPGQAVDGDGAPSGPGDPFQIAADNRLDFRVRNLGTAVTPNLGIRITAEQPPHVACGGSPPKILDQTVFLQPIAPGETATGTVDLYVPTAQTLRVRAKILYVPGEATVSNNLAERTFHTGTGSAVVTPDGPLSVTVNLGLVNGCPDPIRIDTVAKLLPVLPIPDPDPVMDRWQVSDPGLVSVLPGESVPLSLTITPPGAVAPGQGVSVPLSFLSAGGLTAQGGQFGEAGAEIDTFPVGIPVVVPSALTADVAPGPYAPGSPVLVSGMLTPALAGTTLGVRFSPPSGPEVLVQAATDSRGSYGVPFTPSAAGPWRVEVLWQGDESRAEARSPAAGFLVVTAAPCLGDPDCDDGNPCTQDQCDRASGHCSYSLLPDGTACADGALCRTGATCQAGACGQPVVCDDLSACTADSCDPSTGACLYQPRPLPEVPGVGFQDGTTLGWEPGTGASFWNTYRGSIPQNLLGSRRQIYDDTCLESADAFDDGALITSDAEVPPAGTAFYYRVTEVTLCGEGPAGITPLGDPAVPPNPCVGP